MAAGILGGLFGGGSKKTAATTPSTSTDGTPTPTIKQLGTNDAARRSKLGSGSSSSPVNDWRSRVATILSDKLGN